MKKILFTIVLAIVAVACHTNELGDVQMGKININAATRSEVSDYRSTSSTKTVLDEGLIPSAKELKVEIVGADKTYTWNTLSEFNNEEELLFPAIAHTITLSHGEKGVEGWSKPYFEGSTNVVVPGYKLGVNAEILVVLANSIATIETTEQFSGYFPKSEFTINGIAWEPSRQEMLFVNPGEVTIVCEAERASGSKTTIESKVTFKPTTRHRVVFELSTVGSAVVNITFDDEIIETIKLDVELNEKS